MSNAAARKILNKISPKKKTRAKSKPDEICAKCQGHTERWVECSTCKTWQCDKCIFPTIATNHTLDGDTWQIVNAFLGAQNVRIDCAACTANVPDKETSRTGETPVQSIAGTGSSFQSTELFTMMLSINSSVKNIEKKLDENKPVKTYAAVAATGVPETALKNVFFSLDTERRIRDNKRNSAATFGFPIFFQTDIMDSEKNPAFLCDLKQQLWDMGASKTVVQELIWAASFGNPKREDRFGRNRLKFKFATASAKAEFLKCYSSLVKNSEPTSVGHFARDDLSPEQLMQQSRAKRVLAYQRSLIDKELAKNLVTRFDSERSIFRVIEIKRYDGGAIIPKSECVIVEDCDKVDLNWVTHQQSGHEQGQMVGLATQEVGTSQTTENSQ